MYQKVSADLKAQVAAKKAEYKALAAEYAAIMAAKFGNLNYAFAA